MIIFSILENSGIDFSFEKEKEPYYYFTIKKNKTEYEELTIPKKFCEKTNIFILHELSHATGTPERLFRGSLGVPDKYHKEEVIAEISAILTAKRLHLPFSLKKSISYIKGWIEKDSIDIEKIFEKAAKSSNYILDNWWKKPFIKDVDSELLTKVKNAI